MTIGKSFLCPTCGEQVFHLKMQADNSLMVRKWPFSITCNKCHDVINGSYSREDRLEPDLKEADICSDGIVFGYSDTLPIPDSLYYQPYKGIGISSVFMSITLRIPILTVQTVIYGNVMRSIENNLVRYRYSLGILYNMLKGGKTNVKAFTSKMCEIFDIDKEKATEFKTSEDCYECFQDLHRVVFYNIKQFDKIVSPLFGELLKELKTKGVHSYKTISDNCFGQDKLPFAVAMDSLFRQLHKNIELLPKLLPAFYIDILDTYQINLDNELRVVTVSLNEMQDLYKDNFNELVKFLPLFIACYNEVYHGNYGEFRDANGQPLPYTFESFLKHPDGNKINALRQSPAIEKCIKEAFDHHVRNGIDHKNIESDHLSQTVKYHYDQSDWSKEKELRWIRLSHMCLSQMRWLSSLTMLMWDFNNTIID